MKTGNIIPVFELSDCILMVQQQRSDHLQNKISLQMHLVIRKYV